MSEPMVARYPDCAACLALSDLVPRPAADDLEGWAARLAHGASSADALYHAVVALAEVLDADRASLLVPLGHGALRVVASSDSQMIGDLLISLDRYPELEWVLEREEPLLVEDIATFDLLEKVRHLLPGGGVGSLVAAFVHLGGASGVLRVTSRRRALSADDLAVVRLAAHLLEHVGEAPQPATYSEPWIQLMLRLVDVVFEVAADGRVLHVHGPVEECFGVAADALAGTSFEEHLPVEQLDEARRRLAALLGGDLPSGAPIFELHLAGGPAVPVRVRGALVPGAAPRVRLAVTRLDAREPERSENRLFDRMPLPLLLSDDGGLVVNANPAFAALADRRVAEILGRPVADLIEERGLDTYVRSATRHVPVAVSRAVVSHQPNTVSVLAFIDLGPFNLARERASQMRSALENRIGELEMLQLRLGELESLKSRFLSASAHELKTPLTVIESYLETFLSDLADGLTPEQHEFLQVINESVLRLRRLVTDLVDLAALDSGRIHMAIDRVSPAPLATRVVREMEGLAARAGVKLASTLAGDLAALRADPDRVHQVLTNLVDNAVKYTPEGGTVTLAAEEEGDSVRLEVRDSGVGIPAEHLAAVFDEFVQAPRPAEERRAGAGLGLTICRRVVRAMGGRIEAAANDGGGTVVRVWLPRWPADEGEGKGG